MTATVYPGAKKSLYSGSSMATPTRGVFHSTETRSGVPGYQGGLTAPHLTAVPNFDAERLEWYQHYRFDQSSRSLRNLLGGVETNTLRTLQIEIVGTCDPVAHKNWKEYRHLYMPELPKWAIRDLGEFVEWADRELEIPMKSGLSFIAYPGSYGATDTRLTFAEWRAFTGWCGHQHVPENAHGDPGDMNVSAIIAVARNIREDRDMPTPAEIATAVLKAPVVNENVDAPDGETTVGKMLSHLEVTQDKHGISLGEIKGLLSELIGIQKETRDLLRTLAAGANPK